ncbi:ESF1 homolog isoform X2 [Lytechinus variegatus]|uniref:ESF1 homolog isoform X2 n=1 Tax=Lytechinus variegatus TaxID=7654 RepID=UPI001BB26502|nr:ESF1 homolog isoform X2 [Lytechinus variegatus]
MDFKSDSRFAAVAKDPRYRQVPKLERKVKIDKRFQGMFTDKRFKLKYSVDKRGRPENQTSKENLKKFYELEEDEEEAIKDVSDEDSERGESAGRHCLKKKQTRRRSGREVVMAFKRRKARLSASEDRGKKISDTFTKKAMSIPSSSRDQCTLRRGDRLTRSEEDDSDSEDDESGLGSDDTPEKRLRGTVLDSESDSESDTDSKPSWQKQMGVDFARGEGNIETSSSESDSDDEVAVTSTQGPVIDEICHSWGELDAEAPREEATSCRLAVCNIDWDCVTASDLFVLLNSFKPSGGVLHSVKIYPSEFGLERMREEDAKGPQELVEKDKKKEKLSGIQQERYQREKLRKYQMQRLKYYYAVVDCDSADTANAIYDQCDGMEYETSASKLDLRFVPDDTTFDHEPKDTASEAPDASQFKPLEFQTTALTRSSVQLTWDENDKRRAKETDELFKSRKKMEEMESHIQAYLASSSEEEEEEEEEDGRKDGDEDDLNEEDSENDNPESEKDRINKYRNLLKGIEEKEKQDGDKDMEMEISWEPGLKESTQEIVKKKAESTDATPWEKYLEKKKEKKKERKQERKKLRAQHENAVETEEPMQAFSDDELPDGVDLNDSFFKDSLKESKSGGKSKKKGKKEEVMKTDEELKEEKQRKAALELLMLDEEDDGRQHFNLKNIMENENMTKSKRKRQLKQQRKLGQQEEAPAAVRDNFEINTADPRFDALFTSHEYAIDPSDPQYKKTKAMETLISEKQKRREKREVEDEKRTVEKKEKKMDVEVSQLVRSIKNKTEQFHSRKKLKTDS